jgi:hypothetical protein
MSGILRLNKFFFIGFGAISAAGVALHCAPSEDTSVSIVTQCDAATLNVADPAEATVKVYLETASELQTRAAMLVSRFKDTCNAINRDLGAPEGGDVHAACNPIADRIAKAAAIPPVPDGGILKPVWAAFNFDALTCPVDAVSEAKCLDQCSGQPACDPSAKCAPGKSTGTCAGNCTGTCSTSGDTAACVGGCFGKCAFPSLDGGGAPEGGVPACGGECVGTCGANSWLGRCSTGCGKGFLGQCLGTCTGLCDGVPYSLVDAGADPDAAAEGGILPGAPGAGNCTGVCAGACAGQASGQCGAKCAGDFSGGACGGVGNCVGTCSGPGIPCTTTCAGTCKQHVGTCAGSCTACAEPLTGGKCVGTFDCGTANPICTGTCILKGALAAKCGSSAVATTLAGDYKLYDAVSAHMVDFTAIAREANVINGNLSGVLQQTSGAFHAIGVVHDNARLCAASANPIYDDAKANLTLAISASLIVNGTKF